MHSVFFRYKAGTERGNTGGTDLQKIRFSNSAIAQNYYKFLLKRDDVEDVCIHEESNDKV